MSSAAVVIGALRVKITLSLPQTGSKPPLNAYVNPDNSLTLTAVDSFNSGTYTCTATNARGSSIAQAKLTVERKLTAYFTSLCRLTVAIYS